MVKKRTGFTLIELMVVIAILGVLSTLLMGNFFTSMKKGRDAKRKGDLTHISKALEMYFNDKGAFPVSTAGLIICDGGCAWGGAFSEGGVIYMAQLPDDPQAGKDYYYDSDGTHYQLYAQLENLEDMGVPKSGTIPMYYSGTTCATGNMCNFGVASTNITPEEDHGLTAGEAPDVKQVDLLPKTTKAPTPGLGSTN